MEGTDPNRLRRALAGPWSIEDTLALAAWLVGAVHLAVLAQHAAYYYDEFNVIAHTTRFADGDYTHSGRPGLLWFALMPLLQLEEPSHILSAFRWAAWAAAMLTIGLVWALTRWGRTRPATKTPPGWSATAVLLLVLSGSFIDHAVEVRTDTFVLPLTLGAILALASGRIRGFALAGLLLGLGCLVSQKTLYNLSGIGLGVLVTATVARWPRARLITREVARYFVTVGVALAIVIGWYAALQSLGHSADEMARSNVSSGVTTAFTAQYSFARKLGWLRDCVVQAPLLWTAALPGFVLVIRRAMRGYRAEGTAAIAGLFLLASIGWHRGFFPYFIASFEPLLAVPAAYALAWLANHLTRRWRSRAYVGALPAGLALVLSLPWFMPSWVQAYRVSWDLQRNLLDDVYATTGDPVVYWDGVGMVPKYEHAGIFLTHLSREGLRRRMRSRGLPGEMAIAALLAEHKPVFVIRTPFNRDDILHPIEQQTIFTNYVPVRPNLYIHAMRMTVDSAMAEQQTRVAFLFHQGAYTARKRGDWQGNLWIDEVPVEEGTILDLDPGPHQLTALPQSGRGELAVVWGRDTEVAQQDHVDYSMFPLQSRARFQQYGCGTDEPCEAPSSCSFLTPGSQSDPSFVERREQHLTWQRSRNNALAPSIAPGPRHPKHDLPDP